MNKAKIYAGLVVLFLGCSSDDVTPKNKIGSGIVGRWRLFETSGSIGGGSQYITPIPTKPLQALTFNSQGQVSKEGDQLGEFYAYPFYRVDSSGINQQLRFLTSKQDTTGFLVRLSIRRDTMRIFPFCVEGCSQSFVRIE